MPRQCPPLCPPASAPDSILVSVKQVPEVGITLVCISPNSLALLFECHASPAAEETTWAHPMGASSTLHALSVVLHILLVATLPSVMGWSLTIIGWTRIACSALSLTLLQIRVVNKLVSKPTQPLKSGDGANSVAVCLHCVGLTHPKDGKKHPPIPAPGQHCLLQAVGPKAITVEQVNPIEIAPVSVMHARLSHLILGGLEGTSNPLCPVPLHLVSKGGYPTRTNQEKRYLVHEGTSKEPSLSHLQLYLGLHELGSVALPLNCFHQVLLGEATVASLDGQDAVQT